MYYSVQIENFVNIGSIKKTLGLIKNILTVRFLVHTHM